MNNNLLHILARLCIISFGSSFLVACGGGGGGGGGDGAPASTDITISLPIKNYTIDSDSIKIDTGSGLVHASIGPFGAHLSPLTGHLWGDAKGNIIAYLARSDAELTLFYDANTDGICESSDGDICGFYGGTNIFDLRPTYIAPVDATVTWVSQDVAPGVDAIYLNGQPHWQVTLELNSRYQLTMGHLGAIASDLHDKILAATGIDTDTYVAGDGVNLLNGTTIPVLQGETLAYPQLVASEVAGHPGYYKGGGTIEKYPWAQMEFGLIDNTAGADACIYDLMSAAEQTSLTNAMITEMQSPTSPRYGFTEQANIWKWGAEAVLCPVYTAGSAADFSDIHTHLGGWLERDNAGVVRDEILAVIKIQTDSALYDASNYTYPEITHLVSRSKLSLTPAFNWTMPDATTPGDIYYPTGEVLEETANSMLIKWRDFSNIYTAPIYQRIAFALDADGLKVKWGNIGASEAATIQPVLGSDACNDIDVICYDHRQDLHP